MKRDNNRLLYIDSTDKLNTGMSNENFTMELKDEVDRVTSVKVVSAEIPYSFFGIKSSNNTLQFVDDATATPYSINVTPGNYDGTQFAAAMQTAMNDALAGFTVTYNTATYKLTWTRATAFIIKAASTISTAAGITADSAATTSFTSQGTINLSGPNYLLIKSTKLTQATRQPSIFAKENATVLHKFLVMTGPGTTLVNIVNPQLPIVYGSRQKIKTIDFQLVLPNGEILDLNGQNWSMTVQFDIS